MPVVLKIDPQRKVVYSAFYGRITDAELLEHKKVIASEPDFNPNFDDIVDFSDVTVSEVSEETIAALAANPTLFSKSVRHIVVAPDAVMFQLGRKFKELAQSSRPNFSVVKTRDQAYRLLPSQHKAK